jgi:hypothetical protein
VVHARKGENDKAVEVLLQAFETHPSYAQVQTNLKAIYAALASQAYNRALNIGSTTKIPRANLGILDQVYNPTPAQIIIAASEQTQAKNPSVVITETAIKTIEKQPSELIIEERLIADARIPSLASAQPDPQAATTVATPTVNKSTDSSEKNEKQLPRVAVPANEALLSDEVRNELQQLITNWASSWSAQNIETYLDFYTRQYSPSPKVTHKQWVWGRHERFSKPTEIKVEISDISLAEAGKGQVRSVFRQTYQSETYQDMVYKTLIFVRENGLWKITTEWTL